MYRILYIDDEPDLLDICKFFLEESGQFRVDVNTSASAVLKTLPLIHYDAIISDYQMPGMDGIEFLKKVRSSGNTIPFILFTGKGREEVVIQAINEGADFYIQKGGEPVAQFTELAHKVRQAVQRRQAEASIHDLERREADILNFLPDATFAIDIRGVVIAWNKAIEEMTGVPAAGIIGKGNYEYAIPFYNERRPILIDLILEPEDRIGNYEYTITKREGNVLVAETAGAHPKGLQKILSGRASLLYNKQGDIAGAIESIRDITEAKKSHEELRAAYEQLSATEEELRAQYITVSNNEKALRESEKAYRTIFEHTGSATIQVEEDTTISIVNSTFETLTGYSRSEIEGIRKWTEFVEKEDLEKMVRFHKERRKPESRPPEQYEFRLITKHGEIKDILLCVGIIPGTKKTVATLFDLSERKKMEQALQESEVQFRTLVENAPDAIFIQAHNRFVYLNTAAVQLFGATSPEELLGTNPYDRIHPSFHELIHRRVRSLTVALKAVELVDEIYVKMDGTPFDVEVAAVPFRYRGENGALIFFRDITGRKRMELELRAANEQLIAAGNELTTHYYALADKEQKLRQSEARYRNVVEVQTEFISRFRPDGTHVFVNDAYCRYFKKTAEAIIGHIFLPEIPAEDKERVQEHFARLTPSNPVDSIEHRIIMPNGEIRWQRWNDRAIFNDSGKVIEYQSVGRDITDRIRTEEALRESEERYRFLIENASVAIGVVQNKKFVLINKKATEISGYSQKEMLDLPIRTFIYPDDLENVQTYDLNIVQGKKISSSYTLRIVTKSGSVRWLDVQAVRILWNTRPATLNFYIDITEQKKAEESLRESERKYRSILDDIQDVIYQSDLQGTLTMVSSAGARSLGYDSPEEIIGRNIADYIYAYPEKRKEFLSLLAEKGAVYNYPLTVKLRDGSHRYATANSHFYYRADGTRLGVEGIIHDITDIRRAEDALRLANRQLNLLTSITRHDMLNKIMAILGYLALMKKKSPSPEIQALIDSLETATKDMRSQVEFTRIYQDLGIHEPQWQDISYIISRLGIPSSIAVRSAVPGLEILADPLLEKVFSNLLDNTLRHGNTVTRISISCDETANGLILTWGDDGTGIPAADKEHIFEWGYGKHTGFGLFLIREILAITGITIRENGTEGEGARFEMTVPDASWRMHTS